MENREEQELGVSPWWSATTSDEYWDSCLVDNPQFPISVAPTIDEIVDGSRQDLHRLFPINQFPLLAPIIHRDLN
jgi:hypothetical protein